VKTRRGRIALLIAAGLLAGIENRARAAASAS
jgi:hypothetical protein